MKSPGLLRARHNSSAKIAKADASRPKCSKVRLFAATTSPWYFPTCGGGHMPLTSQIAHRRSPPRYRSSTGNPVAISLDSNGLKTEVVYSSLRSAGGRHAARDSAVDQRACTATEPWRKGACRWGSSSVSWWAEYPANGVVATGSDPIVRTVSGLREREGVRSNREVAGMKAQSRAACSLRAPDQWVSRWHGPYIAWRRGGSC